MAKMIFVNANNPNLINFDLDNESWMNSPRLVSLNKNSKDISICLLGIQTTELPINLLPSVYKINGWGANLYTSTFQMKEGFYPLFWDGQRMFFTDKKEYSLMNQNWALDNVYNTPLPEADSPKFEKYVPALPETKGWQRGIIPAKNIRIYDLFNEVTTAFPSLDSFFQTNQNANVEITYNDKYVRSELAMIICLQFIKRIEDSLHPSSMKVKITGMSFQEINANDEQYRRLTDTYMNDNIRDEKGGELINDSRFEFISKRKEDIPHYRELLLNISKNGATKTLRIMPDAGLAHWGFDIGQQRIDRKYYKANSGLQPEIPITSSTEQVYYICIS